ncbi:type II toxin-antitoxin system HipA family toxin [Caballeronia novacaledonica]|uniref:Type II toxin-antitoxin system HipA family toxin n=2 Tax=Caballeronia novacaledonica TaxID=1544861 RepID=A0AA37MSH1_9BURK|nr:HipA domain-containing protein [Caballeronia novacaledonica]GJH18125.1 type II toxin-antitoxin system HipA family toxin [Caballeronia novacaledonica]GJH25874.1 type II toxin-antitoxin system HipA family toxin [Caballeronia novacaledonica]
MTGAEHLLVFAHLDGKWTQCGRLAISEKADGQESSTFEYDEGYLALESRVELDPVSLSLRAEHRVRSGLRLPKNALPLFGAFRDASPDAFGRRVIESRLCAQLNGLPEAQYLLNAGPHRIGALDFRLESSTKLSPQIDESFDLEELGEAAACIDDNLAVPRALQAIFTQGAGLGGARPKASVRDEQGLLWVAKFPTKNDAFDVASIECATLTLAAKTGVHVPEVKTVAVGGRRVFMSRRFDRFWAPPGSSKSHALRQAPYSAGLGAKWVEHHVFYVSALTMSGRDEGDSRLASYADIAAAGLNRSRTVIGADDAAQIYKRMLIDIFVSNDDGHLRNTGYIYNDAFQTWQLSPCFDVVPRPSLAFERFLHLQVGEHGRAATLDNAFSWHQEFLLSEKHAYECIAEAWNVVRDWRQHFEDSGVHASDIEKVAPAFRSIDDIASPELRRRLP